MSLTNDTLIHSLPYFHGPGVSSLMHLGWRASSPGPSHRSHTLESAPVLRMLFAQIAPFVFEYEMPFLNMSGDHTYSLREHLRCERYFILKWDCVYLSLLSIAVKKILRILQVYIYINVVGGARLLFLSWIPLFLLKFNKKKKSLNAMHEQQCTNMWLATGIYIKILNSFWKQNRWICLLYIFFVLNRNGSCL